jgi:hypothetical protein
MVAEQVVLVARKTVEMKVGLGQIFTENMNKNYCIRFART